MKKKSYIYIYILGAVLCILPLFLLSCDESRLAAGGEEGVVTTQGYADVALENATFTGQPTPEEVFAAFSEMVEEVQTMSREQVEALSDEEILELGEPIRLATEGTIQLSEKTLQQLREPLGELTDRFLTMTREEHQALSSEIDKIITSDGDGGHERRSLTADQIRDVLMELSGGMMTLSSTCEQMFTIQGDRVILMVGDNFNLANSVCPAGTPFIITSGVHTQQYVSGPKQNNTWLGGGSWSIMDGQNSSFVLAAFSGMMTSISLNSFKIRNYTNFGISSQSSSSITISGMTFKNIGANKNGQDFGAIRLDNSENVRVEYSYFENVTSSVRFRFSDGPLRVLNNEAFNTGRNFFQCDQCSGGNIRINGNSIEHTNQFGIDELEDFISIYRSEGLSNDPIQVYNNRARTDATGNGVTAFGSVVQLGDHGGKYQQAVGNIGVSPGNVGIGTTGGEYIEVQDNKMYSAPIEDISNVAFTSYDYCLQEYGSGHSCGPCTNHSYSGNEANWYCYRGVCGGKPTPKLNNAYSNNTCGLWTSQMNVVHDPTMDETVWDEW